ncbi:MAG: hypothetical protein WCV85_04245 [Patescibacteria group bacterium]|jgi:hypothetical protein
MSTEIILVDFHKDEWDGRVIGHPEMRGPLVFADRNAKHLVTFTQPGFYLVEITKKVPGESVFSGYWLGRVIGGPDKAEEFRKQREETHEKQRQYIKGLEQEITDYLMEVGMESASFDMVLDASENESLPLHFELQTGTGIFERRLSSNPGTGTVRIWVRGISFLTHDHYFTVPNVPVNIQQQALAG